MSNFTALPNTLSETEVPARYIEQFKAIFDSPEADIQSVVYTITANNPIPRLIGESNIIYIGQTKNSLRARYKRYAKTFSLGDNWFKFTKIIEHYEDISFNFIEVNQENLKETERRLLKEYFMKHAEYPPHNNARS
jgi:hypothetical protein